MHLIIKILVRKLILIKLTTRVFSNWTKASEAAFPDDKFSPNQPDIVFNCSFKSYNSLSINSTSSLNEHN